MHHTNKQINYNRIWTTLCAVILFVLPLLRISYGVDITDTSYSLGNFENFQNMDGMWVIATYLANALGFLFTRLPFGHLMIGMNFYSSLLISVTLIASFFFLIRKLPLWTVMIGELISLFLCWCPTPILYNYLTYLIMTFALMALFYGIRDEKRKYLVLAGILLGMNVFVRFSNLAEIGFILVVWYDAIMHQKNLKKGWIHTLNCVMGYLIGFGTIFLVILLQYGWDGFLDMIHSLMNISGNVGGYSPVDMVKNVFLAYVQNIRFTWIAVLWIILVQWIYSRTKKLFLKIGICILGGGFFAIIFYYYFRQGLFTRSEYNQYPSMFFWAMILLVASIAVDLAMLIRKEESRELKILSIISFLILMLTPLGSNNGVFPNFNNLFLVAPLTVFGVYHLLYEKKEIKKYLPMQVAVFAVFIILFFQTMMFHIVFTFRDAGLSKDLSYTVDRIEVLKGMRTTKEKAGMFSALDEAIRELEYTKREFVMFGEAPGIPYFLELQPAISSTWPDLDSYSKEEFEGSLSSANNPVILVYRATYPDLLKDVQTDEKAKILVDYINANAYQAVYADDYFMIFE